MRAAAGDRKKSEQILTDQGWIVVKIPKPNALPNTAIPMLIWCTENLGSGCVEPGHSWLEGNDVWYMFSWFGYWTWHFKNQQDATMFTMRWA
jgi:hypothetical protein